MRLRCPVHSLEIHFEVDFSSVTASQKRGLRDLIVAQKKGPDFWNIGQPAKSVAILLVEQLETEFKALIRDQRR